MSHERAVQQVLARYVRATDRRDGQALSALFIERGTVHIFHKGIVQPEALGELVGREAIANAVSNMMRPHPKNGWSHHTTHDTIIEVNGDSAILDAQFIVFTIVGTEKPENGWPVGTFGAQGTITPIESGYYRPRFVRADGKWLIESLEIYLDLPMVFGA
jgi:SnoaL-like domain